MEQIFIKLNGPKGERLVKAGSPYQLLPGEKIVGHTAVQGEQAANDIDDALRLVATEDGVLVGDMIENMTKALGMEGCAMCQFRKFVINHAKQVGPVETVRLLWKSVKGTI